MTTCLIQRGLGVQRVGKGACWRHRIGVCPSNVIRRPNAVCPKGASLPDAEPTAGA